MRRWPRPLLELAFRRSIVSTQKNDISIFSPGPFQHVVSRRRRQCTSTGSFLDDHKLYQRKVEERQLESMQQRVESILRTPRSAWNAETWSNAQDAIGWLVQRRHPQAVQASVLLLDRLVEEQCSQDSVAKPAAFLGNKLLNALVLNWQQVGKHGRMLVIPPEELLEKLESLCSKSPTMDLTAKALSFILDMVVRHGKGRVQAAELAETLLNRILKQKASVHLSNISNVNRVLSAWASCARPDRAQRLLDKVDCPKDIFACNTLLAAYARAGDGEVAERILFNLCGAWQANPRHRQGDVSLSPRPNVVTWNTILLAWARSKDPSKAVDRARQLLTRMHDPYNAPPVKPDATTMNTVLACIAKSGHPAAGEQAWQCLQEMKEQYAAGDLEEHPDRVSYSAVINALAKCGQPTRAELCFQEMYRLFMDTGNPKLRPNTQVLTTLLEAWSRSNEPNHVEKASEVLQRIHELYQFGFLESGVDTIACNIMLGCHLHSDCPTAGQQAQGLLEEMKASSSTQARPDFRSYSMVVQTWLKQPHGITQAKALIPDALKELESSGVKSAPDLRSVQTLIYALCRENLPALAEQILLTADQLGVDVGASCFQSVAAAWSKVKATRALERSRTPGSPLEKSKKAGTMKKKKEEEE